MVSVRVMLTPLGDGTYLVQRVLFDATTNRNTMDYTGSSGTLDAALAKVRELVVE